MLRKNKVLVVELSRRSFFRQKCIIKFPPSARCYSMHEAASPILILTLSTELFFWQPNNNIKQESFHRTNLKLQKLFTNNFNFQLNFSYFSEKGKLFRFSRKKSFKSHEMEFFVLPDSDCVEEWRGERIPQHRTVEFAFNVHHLN